MSKVIDWNGIPASQYPKMKELTRTNYFWKGQRVYLDKKGWYYHRDPLHNEIEVYDKFRKHTGVLTPEGCIHPKKQRIKGRILKI